MYFHVFSKNIKEKKQLKFLFFCDNIINEIFLLINLSHFLSLFTSFFLRYIMFFCFLKLISDNIEEREKEKRQYLNEEK
jgi:hypothetical protein